jgi:hypothetical protein
VPLPTPLGRGNTRVRQSTRGRPPRQRYQRRSAPSPPGSVSDGCRRERVAVLLSCMSTSAVEAPRGARDLLGNRAVPAPGQPGPRRMADQRIRTSRPLSGMSPDQANSAAERYGSEGWGFESLRARNIIRRLTCGNVGRAPFKIRALWTSGAPTVLVSFGPGPSRPCGVRPIRGHPVRILRATATESG